MSTRAEETLQIAERIKPLLAGHPPEIQGAVLAELTSLWLAGVQGAPELREALLTMHIGMVRKLTPINVALLAKRQP